MNERKKGKKKEIKLYENNWIKNTVTSLTIGKKAVNSR